MEKMGKIIKELRQKRGLGQEEFAKLVGVSAPAVSKWECDKAYPDITLLPTLAKILKTNIDTFFGSSAQLTEAEVNKLVMECALLFDKEGFEAGYNFLQQELKIYPNDAGLQLSFGSLLGLHARKIPENQYDEILEKAIELCSPAANGEDLPLKAAGQQVITSIYLLGGKYDLAEENFKKYSTGNNAVEELSLANIYFKKEEYEKAEKTYQGILYMGIISAVAALEGMANIAHSKEHKSFYENILKKSLELSSVFALEDYPGTALNTYISLCTYYGENEQMEEFLSALDGVEKCLQKWKETGYLEKNKYFNRMKNERMNMLDTTMQESVAVLLKNYEKMECVQKNTDAAMRIQRMKSSMEI